MDKFKGKVIDRIVIGNLEEVDSWGRKYEYPRSITFCFTDNTSIEITPDTIAGDENHIHILDINLYGRI